MSPTTKSEPGAGKPAARRTSAVKVKSGKPEARPDAKRTRYWIGTHPDCPIQNVPVGGINFPRFRGTPVFLENGEPDRELDYGIFIDLTDEDVEFVQEAVKKRVVRLVGAEPSPGKDLEGQRPPRRRGVCYPIDGKNYSPRPGDAPLGRYLYMHRLDQMSAEDLRNFPPECMEEE